MNTRFKRIISHSLYFTAIYLLCLGIIYTVSGQIPTLVVFCIVGFCSGFLAAFLNDKLN
jgi:hypothetical protein